MKRVLMLGYFFPPSKAAGTFRTLRFVRDLPGVGWHPDVLTVNRSTYPAGDTDTELLHHVGNEVRVFRTPAPPLHRWFKQAIHSARGLLLGRRNAHVRGMKESMPSSAVAREDTPRPKRLLRPGSLTEWIYTLLRTPDIDAAWYLFGLWKGLRVIRRRKPHVLYASGGPWTTFLIGRDLSRITGVPLVLDYRDPWSFNPSARRTGGAFERLAHHMEKRIVRQADRIVANTDVLREVLIQAHGESVAPKTVVINNSYDEQDFDAPDPLPEKPFTISYVGSLYDAHNPEFFLRALSFLLERKPQLRGTFRVKLVGSGAKRATQLVLGLGLDDVVEVRGPVSHAEAIRIQRAAHALLLILTVPSDHSTFVPSKLFEYIAARRPIFAVTRGGALRRLLEMRQLTPWIYTPEDLQGMADGLAHLVNRHERGCLPKLPIETVKSFSGASAAALLAAVLDAAAGSSPDVRGKVAAHKVLQAAGTESQ